MVVSGVIALLAAGAIAVVMPETGFRPSCRGVRDGGGQRRERRPEHRSWPAAAHRFARRRAARRSGKRRTRPVVGDSGARNWRPATRPAAAGCVVGPWVLLEVAVTRIGLGTLQLARRVNRSSAGVTLIAGLCDALFVVTLGFSLATVFPLRLRRICPCGPSARSCRRSRLLGPRLASIRGYGQRRFASLNNPTRRGRLRVDRWSAPSGSPSQSVSPSSLRLRRLGWRCRSFHLPPGATTKRADVCGRAKNTCRIARPR
ncbi:MAG: hypothetical protein KatS3mg060_3466 [Dehalococcoidia bacterium]|nr:MAG: hypothetical protein KatS3mg060_3466 [Dehalococcoidia bacterium]